MTDPLIRALVVAGAVGLALGFAWWLGRRRPVQAVLPPGRVEGPAVVVFTRDTCEGCGPVLATAMGAGLTVRRIRYEDEPGIFAAAGVAAVPTTLVIDGNGRVTGAFGGRLPGRAFRKAVAAAGR